MARTLLIVPPKEETAIGLFTSSVVSPTISPDSFLMVTDAPIGRSSLSTVIVARVPCCVRSTTVPVSSMPSPTTRTVSSSVRSNACSLLASSAFIRPSVEMIASAPSRRKTASASSPAPA